MFKILAGCYEQLVLGYKITAEKEADETVSVKWESLFTDHSQLGCIKCLDSNSTFVAAGSSDESIQLYDLTTNRELGALQGHEGAINQVILPNKNRLISCSNDGTVCVWDPELGGLLKTLKGHNGPVTSFALHPSGKLGMSVCLKDGKLRTWNMITGRCIYKKNMKKSNIEFVRWSPSGKHYVTASTRFVQVYDLNTANCIHEWETKNEILTLQFFPVAIPDTDNHILVVGDTSGNISLNSIPSGDCIATFKAHENRIKCVYSFIPPKSLNLPPEEVWLVSVSSDERIKLWKFNLSEFTETVSSFESELLLSIDTSARLTCVTVWQEGEDCEENLEDVETAKEENLNTEESKDEEVKTKRVRKRKSRQSTGKVPDKTAKSG